MPAKLKVRVALLTLFALWLLVVAAAGVAGQANAAPGPAQAPLAASAPGTATLVLNPIADSDVVLSSTSNFGAAADLHVDYNPAGPSYSRGLIQFSLADVAYQLPQGATVLTATLKLHLTVDAPVTQTLTIHTGSGAEWGEDTVNWNNQPGWVTPTVALSVVPGSGDRVWDVTPLLTGWLHGSLSNRGLGLLGPESGPDAYSFIFDSRTGQFPPQLEITYQLPAPTAVPPTQIPIPPHPPQAGQPSLTLSGDTAAAGGQLRVTGFDFPASLCARYDTFLNQNGQAPQLIGSAEPSEGDITTLVFTVPVSAKGNYNIITLGGGHQATTHLAVTPTVQLAGPAAPAAVSTAALSASPTTGAPGSLVTLSGTGFTGGAACAPVNFYWQQNLNTDASNFISLGTGSLAGSSVGYSFAVPNVSNGPAVLWAVGPNNTVATTPFTVCCQTPPPPPPPNPVTVSLCAVADTYVDSSAANPTGSTDLAVGHSAIYNNVQQRDDYSLSLVRFDLTGIPVGATVTQASFQLTSLNTPPATGLSSVQIGVYEMNVAWPENTFTWGQLDNLSPYTTRELSRQSVDKSPGAATAWNIIAAAQDWVDSPASNNGLSVEGATLLVGTAQTYYRGFYGREAGSSTCPRLTVTYDPSTAGPDLYVGGVDLVQATGRPVFLPYGRTAQTVNAGAAPIAGKSTLLRVFPGTATLLSQVTGSVSGYPCGSGSALAGSPLVPVDGPIIALPIPNSARRTNGLNFVLPSSWLSGCIDLSLTVSSMGELESASKLANNTARWNNINFRPTQPLNLVLIPLWNQNNGQFADTSPQSLGPILAWLNAVYPLADGDVKIVGTTAMQGYSQDLPGDGSDLIDDLEGFRDTFLDNNTNLPANPRFIGLVPNATARYGMARNSGRTSPTAGNVAYVSVEPAGAAPGANDPEYYGSTWAQEIAHLFGRMHASNAHGESSGGPVDCQFPNWYFNHGGIGSYGVAFNTETWNVTSTPNQPNDFISPGTQANHAHDFMSYGNVPNWVSPYTFDALTRAFNYLPPLTGRECGSNNLAQAAASDRPPLRPASTAVVDLIRLSGHIHPDHSVAWHASFHSQDVAPALGAAGDYNLELRDAAGNVLATDYFNGAHTTHGDTDSVAFSELLPWSPNTARILLKHHDFVLAEQVVSANAPTVTVTAPTTGASVGGQLNIRWQGNDTDGGQLTYAVLYNSGSGAAWWPIVSGLTATAGLPLSYTVATAQLAGSSQAHIKVLVSDGIHSGESATVAFSLPKKAPAVAILYPADNSRWSPAADEPLLAAAYDAEDGALEGASLVWTSDRDGALGQGSHLHVHLSPGRHRLTLTATDADGQQATASVSVVVGYQLYLPLVTHPNR